jgi:membrane protein DedA with SNARE-associated domain
MVEVIDGLLEALAGLPLWALAAAVAVVMALEASLLTGVVVPGDLVVLFAASTATTPTRFVVLWAAVAAGSVAGETAGYGIGRAFGERVQASRVGRWVGPERWARAADFLQQRGARAVFAGRFLAAVHAVLPIVAGTVRMRARRFLAAAVVGAVHDHRGAGRRLLPRRGRAGERGLRGRGRRADRRGTVAGVVLIRQGIVRVSNTRVDAGVVLAVAALVGFGITIAQEPGARQPDVLAYALGVASAVVLLARRRRPVAVLGATLAVSLAYNLVGYPAGPTNVAVLVAVYSTAAAGRLLLALLAGGAFTGAGIAYRSLVERDPLGIEAFSAAALLPTVALLGDAAYRRRATAGQADAVVDSRGAPRA